MKKIKDNTASMTLYSARFIMLSVAVLYPFIGIVFLYANPTLTDPSWHRFSIAFALLAFFVSTFYSFWVRKNLNIIIILSYCVLCTDIFYTATINGLHVGYVLGICIVICASSIVFSTINQLILFGLFLSTNTLLSVNYTDFVHLELEIYICVLVTSWIVALLMLNARRNLMSQLQISHSIVTNAENLIFIFNKDGGNVYTGNKSSTLGYSEEELSGFGWWNTYADFHSTPFSSAKEAIEFFKSEGLSHLETKIRAKDGSKFYVRWTFSNLEDEQLLAIGTDITPLKIQEKELKKLSYIASNINEYVLVTDHNDKITWVNESFTKITGYTLDEIHGKKPAVLLKGQETNKDTIDYIAQQVRKKKSFRTEILNYDKFGKIFWLSVSTSIITNKKGDIEQFITVGNDITSFKKANEEMLEMSIVVEHTDNLVIIADKNDQITWVNSAFTNTTEFSFDDAKGKNPRDLLAGADTDQLTLQHTKELIDEKNSFKTQILYYTKSGVELWLDIVVNMVLDGDGEIDKIIRVARDITYSQKANDMLKIYSDRLAAVHQIEQALISFKPIDHIIKITLKSLFKVMRSVEIAKFVRFEGEELIGIELTMFFSEDDSKTLQHRFTEHPKASYHFIDELKKGNVIWLNDITKKDNEYLFEKKLKSYVSIPIFDDKKLTGALSIGSFEKNQFSQNHKDTITEITNTFALVIKQKTMQDTIINNNKLLESNNKTLTSLNEELKELGYIISHDIKAPLRGIASLSEYIYEDHKDILTEDGLMQLKLLKDRVLRTGYLVDGILKYSKLANTIPENQKANTLNIAKSVVNALEIDENTKVVIADNLPTIPADPIRLEQLFQNLITNAIKYNNKKNKLIEVECQKQDEYWRFAIKDNGEGIDQKHHDKIFKLFKSLSPIDDKESTGIGLTIVKKIVEMHGGKIWIESKVDEGTTFYFTLPK